MNEVDYFQAGANTFHNDSVEGRVLIYLNQFGNILPNKFQRLLEDEFWENMVECGIELTSIRALQLNKICSENRIIQDLINKM